jgi:ketosteroid isomerase-like protein
MKCRFSSPFILISAAVCLLAASAGAKWMAREDRSADEARAEIERLHQQDVQATFSGKADDLSKLWDDQAVRISPGVPAEIGKAAIYAGDKRDEANGFVGHTVCYNPEIKDLQIAGDWAFEWGYFSYRGRGDRKPGRGKVLRVIKRQPDGSWKFARVIDFPEELPSAAPMSHPCE